jgi:hypothetical protein
VNPSKRPYAERITAFRLTSCGHLAIRAGPAGAHDVVLKKPLDAQMMASAGLDRQGCRQPRMVLNTCMARNDAKHLNDAAHG